MKLLITSILLITLLFAIFYFFIHNHQTNYEDGEVYKFSFELPNKQKLNLADLNGKVILVVNTASKCGLASQFADLEKLYQKYKDKGLVVIATPSADFASQEFEDENQTQKFCQVNFGVSFPVTNKLSVKGSNQHEFYKYARKKLGYLASPKWNFHKYLIDKNGKIVDHFYSTTSPINSTIEQKVIKLLNQPNKM